MSLYTSLRKAVIQGMRQSARQWVVTQGTSRAVVNGATYQDAVARAAAIGFKKPDSIVLKPPCRSGE